MMQLTRFHQKANDVLGDFPWELGMLVQDPYAIIQNGPGGS